MLSYRKVLGSGTPISVVALADAKEHLNITHTYQDDLIQTYIDAAITQAENYTSRSLKNYEVTATGKTFSDKMQLAETPVLSGIVITYYDANNTMQTLSASTYTLQYYYNEPVIEFNAFSELPAVYKRADAIKITYQVGYQDGDSIPTPYKQFVKLFLGHCYEMRTDSADKFPRFMFSLIRPYRKWD